MYSRTSRGAPTRSSDEHVNDDPCRSAQRTTSSICADPGHKSRRRPRPRSRDHVQSEPPGPALCPALGSLLREPESLALVVADCPDAARK